VSDVFEKLRDVVAYAYKMGYHEHGVDLVAEASDALGEWIDKTTALESRLDSVRTLVEAYYNHEQAGTGETLYAIKKIVVERGTTK